MTHFTRTFACGLGAATLLVGCGGEDMQGFPTSDGSEEQLIARAAAYELETEYVPPPGDALHHHTAGFAKILCSGVLSIPTAELRFTISSGVLSLMASWVAWILSTS
ncbi:MAG: hypothetical protein ACPHWZ_05810 [Longimicrobiales bacterium]